MALTNKQLIKENERLKKELEALTNQSAAKNELVEFNTDTSIKIPSDIENAIGWDTIVRGADEHTDTFNGLIVSCHSGIFLSASVAELSILGNLEKYLDLIKVDVYDYEIFDNCQDTHYINAYDSKDDSLNHNSWLFTRESSTEYQIFNVTITRDNKLIKGEVYHG